MSTALKAKPMPPTPAELALALGTRALEGAVEAVLTRSVFQLTARVGNRADLDAAVKLLRGELPFDPTRRPIDFALAAKLGIHGRDQLKAMGLALELQDGNRIAPLALPEAKTAEAKDAAVGLRLAERLRDVLIAHFGNLLDELQGQPDRAFTRRYVAYKEALEVIGFEGRRDGHLDGAGGVASPAVRRALYRHLQGATARRMSLALPPDHAASRATAAMLLTGVIDELIPGYKAAFDELNGD